MDTIFEPDTPFLTGSGEHIAFADIATRIGDYLEDADDYTIDVGTDSQKNGGVKFVTAIVVHKVYKGGIFFYRPVHSEPIPVLHNRIIAETTMSINCANELLELFLNNDILRDITIHCDVGQFGKTRELIREVVGYVTSCGFDCKIKPESYAASAIADRYTK